MNSQKFSGKTILRFMVMLVLFPITITYFLVKSKLPKAQKIGAIVILWIVFIGISSFANKEQTTTEHIQQVNASPTPTAIRVEKKSIQEGEKVLISDKIKTTVNRFYKVEPMITKKDSTDESLSSADLLVYVNLPLNHDITSCKQAKQLSYRIIEALYQDDEIRPRLLVVRVIVPNYLKTSLSYKDGVPMATQGSFSGQTNYWKVMAQDPRFQLDDEEVVPELRTYGIYLKNCK